MPYNNVIARGEVPMSEDYAAQIIDNAKDQSAAMLTFRRATVSKSQQRFPVLAALPTAYWVNGDTGLKQTTEMSWTNKYLNIEELAAIVPIPDAVVEDADFDIFGEVRPKLEEAIARALDAAIYFGTNAPASFPTNVVAAAVAGGNAVARGTATSAQGGIWGDIDNLIGALETDGYDPDAYVANRTLKGRLRQARTTSGERLDRDRTDGNLASIDGDAVTYSMRGLWPTGLSAAEVIALQRSEFILGVRRDITYKVLDQAVIQDNTGAIQYNLAQQDMVALRVTFRAGWQVANGLNYDQAVEASRYPAAVLRSPAA